MRSNESIAQFCRNLAVSDVSTDGGIACAAAGAMGAALIAGVASALLDQDRGTEHRDYLAEIKTDSQELMNYLLGMVNQDIQAYNDLNGAFDLPQGSDEERSIRHQAIQHAYKKVMLVEVRIINDCLKALRDCERIKSLDLKPNRKDLEIAGILIEGAINASYHHTMNDVVFIEDQDFINTRSSELADLVKDARNILHKIIGALGELG